MYQIEFIFINKQLKNLFENILHIIFTENLNETVA